MRKSIKKKGIIIGILIIVLISLGSISMGLNGRKPKEKEKITKEKKKCCCECCNKMEYDNYEDLGITSTKTPLNSHLIQEISNGHIYMVPVDDISKIFESDDKGANWTEVIDVGPLNKEIISFFYDQGRERLYYNFGEEGSPDVQTYKYIDLSDNSDNAVQSVAVGAADLRDSFDQVVIGTAVYLILPYALAGDILIHFTKAGVGDFTNNMGAVGVRTYKMSYSIVIGSFIWFLWQWSDENVEIWKWEIDTANFTEVEDLGANTVLTTAKKQRGVAYDGINNLHFILEDSGDANKPKLWSYDISGDIATKGGELNVILMLNRETIIGVQEKGFHLTEDKIYQLHPKLSNQLLLISNESFSQSAWNAITDNFLQDKGGHMFELVDKSSDVFGMKIFHGDMNTPHATMTMRNTIPVASGLFIQITDFFTTVNQSNMNSIVFEGFVHNFTDQIIQQIDLRSPSIEIDDIFPSGSFSGSSQSIINTLISNNAGYITIGTLDAGTALGTITFGGDITLRQILNELCLLENFIWYLTPQGELYFNAGNKDSLVDISETSPIWGVVNPQGRSAINKVNINGAIVNGVQFVGVGANNLSDQQTNGINPLSRTISFLNSQSLVNQAEINILARLGTQAKTPRLNHYDVTVGFIQPGEEITFQFNKNDPTITSAQYGIRDLTYNARQGIGSYRISDRII